MPSSYRLLRPQHPSASFLSSVEKNRKSSPRPLFISSTALRAWHPVEPMSTTSPGPVANQRTQVPPRVLQLWDFSGSRWPPRLRPKPAAEGVAGTADTKETYCAIWPCQKLPELVFPSCFSHRSQLEKQNDAKHNIPWDPKTLEIADT